MAPRTGSYHCAVCGWRGPLEPIDFGGTVPCPQCGTYLHPLSWMQTWGFALALIGTTVAAIYAAALLMR